ncbi:Set1/Ash2 histone methyltransferase complex subunit ASH2 [Porites harrisoni]
MADEDVEMENFSEERAESASDFAADDENEKMDGYDALESEPEMRVDRSLTDNDLLIALAQVSENKDMLPGNGHIGKESSGTVPRKSARGKRKLDSSQQLSSSKKSKGDLPPSQKLPPHGYPLEHPFNKVSPYLC